MYTRKKIDSFNDDVYLRKNDRDRTKKKFFFFLRLLFVCETLQKLIN